MNRIRQLNAIVWTLALAAPAIGQTTDARSQVAVGESLTITAEVLAFDPATREILLEGPLGGEIEGEVSDEVEDLSELQPGALVSVTYYQAIAASIHREGEAKPLATAADAAGRMQPGMSVDLEDATSETLSVVSVDLATNTVVFEDAEGELLPTEVERPEFQAKLKDLKPGDQVDVTYSEALVTGVEPLQPGEEANATMKVGTLVIDRGVIVRRVSNTLVIRNESGRMVRVEVDPDFKFIVDGKETSVYELEEGTRLTRTALRVSEVSYAE